MNTYRQRGVSTITAIFLITVMAGLGVAGTTMLLKGQNSETLDLQARRANLAAQSGIEMGLWLIAKYVPPVPPASLVCPTGFPADITDMPGSLAPYTVTVTCVANRYTEGGLPFDTYRLTAVACNRLISCPAVAGDGYVESVVKASWPL